jgi:hypothetical protein
LVAIVRDAQGNELMRWSFKAEAKMLAPGATTGFRSEMFDPGPEAANVMIVLGTGETVMR